MCLATYFGGLSARARWAGAGAADGRACTSTWCARRSSWRRASKVCAASPTRLSLGVVDGRNVWRADLDLALDRIDGRGRADRRRAGDDRPVVLAAARARASLARGDQRSTPKCVGGWRSAEREARRACAVSRAAIDARPRGGTSCSERPRATVGSQASLAADPTIRACATASARCATRTTTATRPAAERRQRAARAARRCPSCRRRRSALSPRRRRSAPPAASSARAGSTAARYERFLERKIAHVVRVQERHRPRRAGPRRVRAERHGRVLRRAAATASRSPATAGCRATAARCVKPPIIFGDVVAPGGR